MALINCPECNQQVSDRAPSCPKCGCPIGATPVQAAGNGQYVTTQGTAKKHKGMQLVGSLIMALGVVMLIATWGAEDGPSAFGSLSVLTGFVVYLWARVAAWWNHA